MIYQPRMLQYTMRGRTRLQNKAAKVSPSKFTKKGTDDVAKAETLVKDRELNKNDTKGSTTKRSPAGVKAIKKGGVAKEVAKKVKIVEPSHPSEPKLLEKSKPVSSEQKQRKSAESKHSGKKEDKLVTKRSQKGSKVAKKRKVCQFSASDGPCSRSKISSHKVFQIHRHSLLIPTI